MAKKKKAAKKKGGAKKAHKPAAAKPAAAPRAHKKKESNKFLVWAVVVVVIVILLFLIKGVKKAPEAPAAEEVVPEAPAEVEEEAPPVEEVVDEDFVPETEPGEDLVEEEDLSSGEYSRQSLVGNPQYQDEELGTDLTMEPERFSNFDCVIDEETGLRYIKLKVTNTNSDVSFMISHEGIKKGYNTYFMINALTDMDPGCGTEELAPGESTVCNRIGMDTEKFQALEGVNRLTIQSPNDAGKTIAEAVVVNCE